MGATYSLNLRSDSPVLQRAIRANDPLVVNPLLNDDRLILRDIPDLSTLLPFPYGRLNAPPAQLHSTTTVRCVVNLHKDSLQLLHEKIQKDESTNTQTPNVEPTDTATENPNLNNSTNHVNGSNTNEKILNTLTPSDFLHTLRFNFDSTEPCQIQVYLLASETTNDTPSTPLSVPKLNMVLFRFPRVLNKLLLCP